MNRQLSQSGSAHGIVVIALIVALIGTLGVVFYQNFIAKDDAAPIIERVETPDMMDTARVAFENDIYAVDYPKEWTVNNSQPEGTQNPTSSIELTSPDQAVQVDMSIARSIKSSPCDTNDGLNLRYYNVHSTPVTSLTNKSLYVVETMTDYPGGGYRYKFGLVPDGGETHATLGDSHCVVKDVGIASSAIIKSGKLVQPAITATISFPKLTGFKESKAKSMDEVTPITNTNAYKEAIKILESARKE